MTALLMTSVPLGFQQFGKECPPPNVIDPDQDELLIGQFPTLIALPLDPKKRQRLLDYSILFGEQIRYGELMHDVLRAESNAARTCFGSPAEKMEVRREAGRRAFHRSFADTYDLSETNYARDMALFVDSMRAARQMIRQLLEVYFHKTQQFSLGMCSEVDAACDPVDLLRLCRTRGRDSISRIRQFEAQRQLTLAQAEFELRLNHCAPERLDKDRLRFVHLLEERYFEPKQSDQVTVLAELNPENGYRVQSFRVISRNDPEAQTAPTRTRAVIHLDVRMIKVGGREIRVYFDSRSKENIPIKLILKRERYHETLTDLNGVKLVFFDLTNDLMDGVRHMRQRIVRVPGSVSGEASNAMRAGVVDPSNRYSSEEYRATKYNVRIFNRIVEFQFMYLPDWINELLARERENHSLYKLLGYLDRVFPVLFPTEWFHLDWRDPKLRQALWDLQIAKL